MSLRDRLQKPSGQPPRPPHSEGQPPSAGAPAPAQPASGAPAPGPVPPPPPAQAVAETRAKKGEQFELVKSKIHSILVDNLEMRQSQDLTHEDVVDLSYRFLDQYLAQEKIPMSRQEREILVRELVEEVLGLGPLEQLLRDPYIADILINGAKNIYVEKFGKLVKSDVTFKDDEHLLHIIERIVSAVGRRVDEKTPMVDARLKDGSRFNAIIPPLSLDGPAVSIRKFKQDAGTLEKLLNWKSMTPEMAQMLDAAVKCRLNIIISGGTGAGKTTLLNSLSSLIPLDERIITIEDSAELQLQQDHVVRLETRVANIEGEGAISARQLVINALRMRPDRIIVGECRGPETLDMLQAMNTGHDGSLTTLHANTPRDAIARITTMCLMNDNPLPEKTINQQIAAAVHLIIQASRLQDGGRKVTSISEVIGMEGDVVTMQEIFKFHQYGVDAEGKVIGEHLATGIRPRFADICRSKGIDLPNDLFVVRPTLPQGKALMSHGDDSPMPVQKPVQSPASPSSSAQPASQAGGNLPGMGGDFSGLRQALMRKKDNP